MINCSICGKYALNSGGFSSSTLNKCFCSYNCYDSYLNYLNKVNINKTDIKHISSFKNDDSFYVYENMNVLSMAKHKEHLGGVICSYDDKNKVLDIFIAGKDNNNHLKLEGWRVKALIKALEKIKVD